MTQQIVNIGSTANSKNGDPLRTAFNKINQNFTELYGTQIPSQTGNSGKFLTTNGSALSWTTSSGGGGGITASSADTLTNKSITFGYGTTNTLTLRDVALTSYTGSGNNVVLQQTPTLVNPALSQGMYDSASSRGTVGQVLTVNNSGNAVWQTPSSATTALTNSTYSLELSNEGHVYYKLNNTSVVNISVGLSGAGINAATSKELQISTNGGSKQWAFTTDGNITLPPGGDITRSGVSVLGAPALLDGGTASTRF